MDVSRGLATLFAASYPLVYVYTHEEGRALETLYRVGQRRELKMELLVWSVTEGLLHWADGTPVVDDRPDYIGILDVARGLDRPCILVLKDYDPYLDDPLVVRGLRDLAALYPETSNQWRRSLVILAPQLTIPAALEKEMAVVDFPLPDQGVMVEILDRVIGFQEAMQVPVRLEGNGDRDAVVGSLLGLTRFEAENVLAKATVTCGELSTQVIPYVLGEKEQIVRKSGGGAVEYIHPRVSLANVGGLDLLKKQIAFWGAAFGEKARCYNLAQPRGALLIGEPGCGKSLSVKAMAALWQVPLLRVDIGALFTSALGGTEERLRQVLKLADSLGHCCLWLDEVEKGLSGLGSSNMTDGGVQARIFSSLLTWMEEHTTPVFVAATANLTTLHVLPPEFIQRFTAVFFIDKPSDEERAEIIRIHLEERGREPDAFDVPALVKATTGMVGRKIRNAIYQGMYLGFAEGREFTTEDILAALQIDKEGMRDFGGVRARPASTHSLQVTPSPGSRTGRALSLDQAG